MNEEEMYKIMKEVHNTLMERHEKLFFDLHKEVLEELIKYDLKYVETNVILCEIVIDIFIHLLSYFSIQMSDKDKLMEFVESKCNRYKQFVIHNMDEK